MPYINCAFTLVLRIISTHTRNRTRSLKKGLMPYIHSTFTLELTDRVDSVTGLTCSATIRPLAVYPLPLHISPERRCAGTQGTVTIGPTIRPHVFYPLHNHISLDGRFFIHLRDRTCCANNTATCLISMPYSRRMNSTLLFLWEAIRLLFNLILPCPQTSKLWPPSEWMGLFHSSFLCRKLGFILEFPIFGIADTREPGLHCESILNYYRSH